ncbi:SNF2 domain-containing protein [Salana multivorans]|uniref:SNF2 domain-containing protein n=1 Tax=Salana multivorans TaxID=120377 RepID=A0A3N2D207_9MICO|nr:helicase-related protein [Salana multivorans]ROR93799.1 SNF2 domain-containing protein [Salana multivorans]
MTDTAVPASRPTFAPGSTVVVRDEDWLVQNVEQVSEHEVHLAVRGISGITRDTEAIFSTAIDHIEPVDPRRTAVRPDPSPGFRTSRLWLESMIRRTPVPVAHPHLTASTGALATVLPFQRSAVHQALDPENLRPRILLADAVGLGKTVEIGMILSELVRRGRGERILVVTPKHVLEQTQFELWTRFALPFVRLDSVGIQRIRQQLPAGRNPFTFYKRVIISIDTLKSDQYIPHLRHQSWDAVVIDESHNVTNSSTKNNRLAELLSQRTDALILASATPHNGRAESFAELVRMLEPSAVLPDGTLNEELVKRLVIRRHRHSPEVASAVGADWAERLPPDNREVPASPIENEIAAELESTWLWPEGEPPTANRLFPWTLAKAFLSSPRALEATIAERLGRLPQTPASVPERTALEHLGILNRRALAEPSAKYGALLDRLREIGVSPSSEARAVVFAERVPTLLWLQEKLRRDLTLPAEAVAVLHGGLSDVEQQEIVESFKLAASPIRVLVTGDVASEGVNLHAQCHHLIHFDIPWSLIRIEQRNGRIDRYGQRRQPQITTLLLKPTSERFAGDFRVLTRLVEREHEAHRALGDSASLMGTYSVRAEEDAVLDVVRGARQFDAVVRTVEQVTSDASPNGLLARLLALGTQSEQSTAPTTNDTGAGATSGLYAHDLDFLRDALMHAYHGTPSNSSAAGGVAWTEHTRHSLASLEPPRDLKQRLRVLPESYLRSRRVTERLMLATTSDKGSSEIAAAREARGDTASTSWPEAHYLAPLHPVLEWAADRALAALSRGQVFAVTGAVEEITVLLQGTLTNKRGQVVAGSYLTVGFSGGPGFGAVTAHTSAQAAIASLGVSAVNRGTLVGDELDRYISTAVDAAAAAVDVQVNAIRAQTSERVNRWQQRVHDWEKQAEGRTLFTALRERRGVIEQERRLADSMLPDRTLIRPLLVVVPEES